MCWPLHGLDYGLADSYRLADGHAEGAANKVKARICDSTLQEVNAVPHCHSFQTNQNDQDIPTFGSVEAAYCHIGHTTRRFDHNFDGTSCIIVVEDSRSADVETCLLDFDITTLRTRIPST